jgi:hypothetical protein
MTADDLRKTLESSAGLLDALTESWDREAAAQLRQLLSSLLDSPVYFDIAYAAARAASPALTHDGLRRALGAARKAIDTFGPQVESGQAEELAGGLHDMAGRPLFLILAARLLSKPRATATSLTREEFTRLVEDELDLWAQEGA